MQGLTSWINALFNDAEGNPAPIGVAADGTSIYPARRNHVHSGPYVLQGGAAIFSPADATTYYFGSLHAEVPTSTIGRYRIFIPIAGTITYIRVYWTNFGGTNSSNENITMNLALNAGAGTLIQTVGNTTAIKTFTNTNINIAVVIGDYVEVEMISPTWGTNPTNVKLAVTMVVQT